MSYLTPHFRRHHGGTGPNISWNLHLLGDNPLLVATVGDDGGEYCSLLEERGISTTHIEHVSDAMTSTAIIGTDSAERQIVFFHPGADTRGTWPDLSDLREEISMAIISPRDETNMLRAVAFCKEYKIPYLFDPGQRIPNLSADDLDRCIRESEAVVVNQYECDLLKEKLNATEENIALLTKRLIVTRGEEGVTVFDDAGALTVPACTADRIINPTGAGDGFRAGLLTGMSLGWPLIQSLRLGCSMGSHIVEIEGTLPDTLDREEVIERANRTYDETLPTSLLEVTK